MTARGKTTSMRVFGEPTQPESARA
jgi:hypothetical protein